LLPSERKRVLDPIERVSEIVFGLLMAQAIMGSLSVTDVGNGEVRKMMLAALTCNIAWGLVDGIMYLVATLTERSRERLVGEAAADSVRLGRRDFAGALGVFLLVVLSTFPVVLPFMFIDTLPVAMRASNLLTMLMLFWGGWVLARYSGGNRWKAGFGLAAIGAALSAAIIALGG
jgi:VIT1/CCC1 family predicted Fe2+/Mn2+ transporter